MDRTGIAASAAGSARFDRGRVGVLCHFSKRVEVNHGYFTSSIIVYSTCGRHNWGYYHGNRSRHERLEIEYISDALNAEHCRGNHTFKDVVEIEFGKEFHLKVCNRCGTCEKRGYTHRPLSIFES